MRRPRQGRRRCCCTTGRGFDRPGTKGLRSACSDSGSLEDGASGLWLLPGSPRAAAAVLAQPARRRRGGAPSGRTCNGEGLVRGVRGWSARPPGSRLLDCHGITHQDRNCSVSRVAAALGTDVLCAVFDLGRALAVFFCRTDVSFAERGAPLLLMYVHSVPRKTGV